MGIWAQMQADLAVLEDQHLRRRPLMVDSPADAVVVVAGARMVHLCSNNYLALANHPEVCSAAAAAVTRWGVGAGASRLLSGTTQVHIELQDALAQFLGTEAAVVTSTGWQANACALAALAEEGEGKGEKDLVVCDKLNHASILDGARATGATVRTWPHGDTQRLRRLLERLRGGHRRCILVTDGLFSMDGDVAPLAELVQVKKDFDTVLVVDEAHALGVLGEGGRGAAEAAGIRDGVDVTVGTLSKAFGALGGFVAGPAVLVDYLRSTARAYIYTTAPPAALCAAAIKSLEIIRSEPHRRRKLLAMAEQLRRRLREASLATGGSASQIIPVVIGPARKALDVSRRLFESGFFVPAIRPPTVPRGTSRLRISLSAGHEADDLARFVKALEESLAP